MILVGVAVWAIMSFVGAMTGAMIWNWVNARDIEEELRTLRYVLVRYQEQLAQSRAVREARPALSRSRHLIGLGGQGSSRSAVAPRTAPSPNTWVDPEHDLAEEPTELYDGSISDDAKIEPPDVVDTVPGAPPLRLPWPDTVNATSEVEPAPLDEPPYEILNPKNPPRVRGGLREQRTVIPREEK